MSELPFQVEEIKRQFDLSGDYTGYDRINNGHINNTYVLHFRKTAAARISCYSRSTPMFSQSG